MSPAPLAIVAGSGPGLGLHLLRGLERGGYNAIGLNRSATPGADKIIQTDLACAACVESVIADLSGAAGPPRVVIHNTAELVIAPFAETGPDLFEATWRSMVLSAVNLAHAVLPRMVAAGGGTFILSGATASLRGGARFSAFSSAKAGLRALSQSLAREYGPSGIHVAHVILDGILDTEASRARHGAHLKTSMRPEDVVDSYLALARQPSSAWTLEMDLRPMGEAF